VDAEIICVGNEIISGFVKDTNSGFISRELSKIGINVKYISAIGDDPEAILSTLDIARYRSQIIIITGGLGPTSDDITMETVSNYFSRELEIDNEIMTKIEEMASKNGNVADNAYKMALIPQDVRIFKNEVGVAPGILIEDEDILVFVLPGVPKEVESLMLKSVIPYLKDKIPQNFIKEKVIKTSGITESLLFEKVEKLDFENSEISFLPRDTGVDLKLRVMGKDRKEVEERLKNISKSIEEKIKDYIYSIRGEEFEEVIGKTLLENGMKIDVGFVKSPPLSVDTKEDLIQIKKMMEKNKIM
jgi:nicotinamide-nucleotide amidase